MSLSFNNTVVTILRKPTDLSLKPTQSSGSGSGVNSNGNIIDTGNYMVKDASKLNYRWDLPFINLYGEKVFSYDVSTDFLICEKTIVSRKEMIAWYDASYGQDASTEVVLNFTYPLVKDISNNITLVYDPCTMAIDPSKGLMSLGGTGTGDGSVYWNDILNKPTTFEPSAHTIGSHSDATSYFTGFVANNAAWADQANTAYNITWANVSGKPSFATVATSGSYNDLINKPSLATVATSGSYNDLINKPTLFSGSYNDLNDKPGINDIAGTLNTDKGGTGLTVIGSALQYLRVNSGGTALEYATLPSAGTVTSVNMTVPTGLAVSGVPITTSGTIALTFSPNYSIPTNAAQIAWNAGLTQINATNLTTDYIPKWSGTQFVNSLVKSTASSVFIGTPTATGDILQVAGTAYASDVHAVTSTKTTNLQIKNPAGTVVWTVSTDPTYSYLIFTNYTSQAKIKVDQSGNLSASGEVTAYASI